MASGVLNTLSTIAGKADDLASLQTQLARFYSQTPPQMSWSANNFKEFANCNLGGVDPGSLA